MIKMFDSIEEALATGEYVEHDGLLYRKIDSFEISGTIPKAKPVAILDRIKFLFTGTIRDNLLFESHGLRVTKIFQDEKEVIQITDYFDFRNGDVFVLRYDRPMLAPVVIT